MAPPSQNSLIKRPELPIIFKDEIIPPALPVANPNASFTRPLSQEEQDIWNFFDRECNGGWHPTSEAGRGALKSLADCLVELSPARYADLQIRYFIVNPGSKFEHHTIREEIEKCRKLCSRSLLSITTEMKHVHDKAGSMWTLKAPVGVGGFLSGSASALTSQIMQALYCRTVGSEQLETVSPHLNVLETTHDQIVKQLLSISHEWDSSYSHVVQLREALNEQLKHVKKGRKEAHMRMEGTRIELKANQDEWAKLHRTIEDSNDKLASARKRRSEARKGKRNAEQQLEDDRAQLEEKRLELEMLQDEEKARPVEFKAAEQKENERKKESEATQMGWWAFNATSSSVEERKADEEWEKVSQAYYAWKASSPRVILKLQQEIRTLDQKIRLDGLKLQRLKGDKMQETAEDCMLEEGKAKSGRFDADGRLEKLENRIRELQTVSEQQKDWLESLDDYGEVVPGLIGHLGEIEINLDDACRAYKHIRRRYDEYGGRVQTFISRMKTAKLSKKDLNDICDEALYLRIIYFVLAAMSGWSSIMSNKLYKEGLLRIAALGTVPEGPNFVRRNIDLKDARKAHQDIYRLAQYADELAKELQQEQSASIDALRPYVENIIRSVEERRPKRISFLGRRPKALGWPPRADGDISETHEMSG